MKERAPMEAVEKRSLRGAPKVMGAGLGVGAGAERWRPDSHLTLRRRCKCTASTSTLGNEVARYGPRAEVSPGNKMRGMPIITTKKIVRGAQMRNDFVQTTRKRCAGCVRDVWLLHTGAMGNGSP